MMAKRVVNGKSALGTSQNEAGSDFPSCPRCHNPIVPFLSHLYFLPGSFARHGRAGNKALLGASEIVESSEFDQEVDILGGFHASLMLSTDSVMLLRQLEGFRTRRLTVVHLFYFCRVIEAFAALQGLNPDCICLAIPSVISFALVKVATGMYHSTVLRRKNDC
jgi:hypothetical protein